MTFHAIGLMSGTSLDGLDICYAFFERNQNAHWNYRIIHAETVSYPTAWERRLKKSILLKAEDLYQLNSDYGFYLGEKTKDFIRKHSIEKTDVIGSHGHTVFHQPQKKYTVQIGDGRAIRLLTDIPVIYDFRSQDVLMGGNGAPLVPVGDRLLFGEYDACLNLGGFSNISFEHEGKRIAFDISPVNTVLNFFAQKKKVKYDENGNLAKSGTINSAVLKKLNALKFYRQKPPKSLGIEWVNREIFPLLKKLTTEDALATFTEHSAEQISTVFENYGLNNILITGGGAYNTYLIERIREKSSTSLIIPEKETVDFKEALIFAFMAVLKINGENNVLSSATGSTKDHCTGLLA